MGKWGNGEMGKWGNGEMGKWERFRISDSGFRISKKKSVINPTTNAQEPSFD